MDEDLDLKELLMKLGIWLAVVVVFGSLMTIILVNRFGSKGISINSKIDKKQTMIILVVSNDTKNTSKIKNIIKKYNIDYAVVNQSKERYFDDFLRKLSISESDIVVPTIIYVEEGKVNSILVNVEDLDELQTFLEYNITSGKEE